MDDKEVDVAEQIGLLWDYTTNKGFPFLADSKQVPILRALLAGQKLEDQPAFAWLKEDKEWLDDSNDDN